MLLLWHLKSYLPAHSILRGFVALHLCDFADAIRAGCAEAKGKMAVIIPPDATMQSVRGVLRQRIRTVRFCCAKEMQSVRGVPKQTEGHCIQTIMCRTMK